MSQHATELCILLVDDVYGELTSRVFEVLLCYGRLPFSTLLHHAHLTPRQLKYSLAVLIQQHLVLWFTSNEDDSTEYEADLVNSYLLLRSGKYIKTVEDQFGELAGGVLSNLLLLGHVRAGDLSEAYLPAKKSQSNLNGTLSLPHVSLPGGFAANQRDQLSTSQGPTLESLNHTLHDLLHAGFISSVNKSHFRSYADNRTEAEKEIPHNDRQIGKFKKEQDFEREKAILEKLKDWKHGTKKEREELAGLRKGNKRPLENADESQDAKRQRPYLPLTRNVIGSTGQVRQPATWDTSYLEDGLVLRVNHDKFAVVARNKRLVELAEQCIGTATSKLYGEVLRKLEPILLQCQDSPGPIESLDDEELDLSGLPQVSTDELVFLLRDSTEFAGGIGQVDPSRIDMIQFDHPKKRRRKEIVNGDNDTEAIVVGDASSDEDEDDEDEDMDNTSPETNISEPISDPGESIKPDLVAGSQEPPQITHKTHLATIRQHLLLLSTHPHNFLHHIPPTPYHPESWAVSFPHLTASLLSVSLISIITSRFGPLAARLCRILLEKGKLDEKTLTSLGLINQKTMRSLLTAMHSGGYLELQEIPRDTVRQPSRTMYLWCFEPSRCRAKILDETYKTMARQLQRARFERERVRSTVEKAERTDVVGREEELLGIAERAALGRWRGVEERILGEVGRLDDLVGVLRDF